MDEPEKIINRVVRPDVLAARAYSVTPPGPVIRLDANENPYPLPLRLRDALQRDWQTVELNRYPDGTAAILRAKLREKLALPEAYDVLVGNGSDELIQMLATLVSPAKIFSIGPTFVMYKIWAELLRSRYIEAATHTDLSLNLTLALDVLKREQPQLTFIAYPNNPTGVLYPEGEVAELIRASPGLCVVDEAYCAFSESSFLPRLSEFPNLLLLRTFSKIGLAGIRLGYVIGHRAWLDQLNKTRSPYNVNALTQSAGLVVLEHQDLLNQQIATIISERQRIFRALSAQANLTVFASRANLLLLRVPNAEHYFRALKAASILVRNLHGSHPLLTDCLRVTIGTPPENDRLLDTMIELCQS